VTIGPVTLGLVSPPIPTCADCGGAMSGDVYLTRRGVPRRPTRGYADTAYRFIVTICQPCSAKDSPHSQWIFIF
jgi:hypothetical protein